MQKAKEYDWKDSNMALFGSATEKQVKKESAESEPAWKGAGKSVGLQIWRIVKFQVTHWEKEKYGEFYNGDSYIVLNTYKNKDEEELNYDVHFWIGKKSTQDEYATAAYKTVELDTLLDDKPVQHREVQGHESHMFLSYFATITLLKGGADTGFRRVLPEVYETRLLHVKRVNVTVRGKEKKRILVSEVAPKKDSLSSEDVFLIDTGKAIYQYNGSECSHDEKFKAAQVLAEVISSRGGKTTHETLEEGAVAPNHPAFAALRDTPRKEKADAKRGERKMFVVSDEDGSLDMDEIAEGDDVSKDKLTEKDVFVINTGTHCYCWIGKGASVDERRNGLTYAANYLNKTETPWLPITVVQQGKEGADFNF